MLVRFVPLLALTSLACKDKGEDTGLDPATFEAGTFQFTNQSVGDGCLDGGMEVLFMPEGTANDWATTTDLPAWDDLPSTYTIDLQDPFAAMEITVEEGSSVGTLTIAGAQQTGVYFNADLYADCTVDMDIDATVIIDDNDHVTGHAAFTVSNVAGASCPVFAADPCDLTLDFTGVRL